MPILANVVMDVFNFIKTFIVFYILPVLTKYYYRIRYGKEYSDDYSQRNFAGMMKDFPKIYNPKVHREKSILFKELQRSSKKKLRILEIGIGSPANFSYYPENCSLVVLEPNKYFKPFVQTELQKYPGIRLENYIVGFGQNMSEIESGSIDVVVTGLVACSVDALDAMLREIGRVLVPKTGKYYFMEHVLTPDKSSKLYWAQQVLDKIGIWSLLFDGCCFKDVGRVISNSEYFSNVNITPFFIEDTSGLWVFKFCKPHLYGIATK